MVTTQRPPLQEQASQSMPSGICLAMIVAAHGVRGEVKLRSYTDNPKDIQNYSVLYLDEACTQTMTVATLRGQKEDIFIAAFKEIPDRNAVDALRGQKLYVQRKDLPEVDEQDAFYIEDLEGCVVLNSQGQNCGHVTAVVNFGASDLLEVQSKDSRKTILIPFVSQWIEDVNLEGRVVTVDTEYFKEMQKPDPKQDEEVSDE
jgi:16S rRNA processing protein RimM